MQKKEQKPETIEQQLDKTIRDSLKGSPEFLTAYEIAEAKRKEEQNKKDSK